MLNPLQQFGKEGQDLAEKFLKKKGLKVLERNYRNRFGEIDLIMRDKKTIVFIEVKARKSKRHGHPLEAITTFKQQQISNMALQYLQMKKALQKPARFDVIAIEVEKTEKAPQLTWLKNAFEFQENWTWHINII